MNIFDVLPSYRGQWKLKSERLFNEEELKNIESTVVIAGDYGNSVEFKAPNGLKYYIPLAEDATIGLGESLDFSRAKLLTLERPGDDDIYRVLQ